MKFKYNYTGNYNTILGKPYLEYETLFFDSKSSDWRSTTHVFEARKIVYPIVQVDSKRKIMQQTGQSKSYNFYDYEIDIDILRSNPVSLLALQSFIIAKLTTERYHNYMYQVHLLENITEEQKQKLNKCDWFGGLNFKMLLGILFPTLLKQLYNRNERVNLFETFRFLLLDYINFNELLGDKIKIYNQIIKGKIKGKLYEN